MTEGNPVGAVITHAIAASGVRLSVDFEVQVSDIAFVIIIPKKFYLPMTDQCDISSHFLNGKPA